MSSQSAVKLDYLYLLVDEDGECRAIQEKELQIYAPNVEGGTHQVIRFLGFSDEARAISGKIGRMESMSAEEKDDDDSEGAEYELSWNMLPGQR